MESSSEVEVCLQPTLRETGYQLVSIPVELLIGLRSQFERKKNDPQSYAYRARR